ncbi:hypothetical protein TNCT_711711, partial [Trichonephila clavata]
APKKNWNCLLLSTLHGGDTMDSFAAPSTSDLVEI